MNGASGGAGSAAPALDHPELALTKDELGALPEAEAVACIDTRRAAVLTAWVRIGSSREPLEIAAHTATQLFLPPKLGEEDAGSPREAFVVSMTAVHAFARARDGERVVVGVAGAEANVGLLLAAIRRLVDAIAEKPS